MMFIHFYSYGKGYSPSGLCRVSGCMNDTWLSIYYWGCFFFICMKEYQGCFLHTHSTVRSVRSLFSIGCTSLLIDRTSFIFIIWLTRFPFDELYQCWTLGRHRALTSWYVNLWVDIFTLFSFKVMFAFVLAVWRMNARLFNGHRLDFILVEQLLEIRSTTSTPPFVWS